MESILAQTYTDFELIVSDHSSTDDTRAALQVFAGEPRVRLERTEAGGGARRNWNRVSELATGEYLKLVCGDDLIRPTMLAEQVAALDASGPRAVMAASRRDLVDARGDAFVKARGLDGLAGEIPGVEALRASVRSGTNIFGEPACVMFRRKALEAAGWWQDLRYFIDLGTYAHVLVQGDFVALPESLASFRVSASQWSVRLVRSQAAEAAEFNRIAQELAPYGAISDADVRRGDRRAKVLALQRRAAYIVLGRRMKARS